MGSLADHAACRASANSPQTGRKQADLDRPGRPAGGPVPPWGVPLICFNAPVSSEVFFFFFEISPSRFRIGVPHSDFYTGGARFFEFQLPLIFFQALSRMVRASAVEARKAAMVVRENGSFMGLSGRL